jgi:hypothetical protein
MSLFDYDTVIVPDFENDRIKDVIPVADFIKSRLAQYNLSLQTAQDARERDELLASMIICNASLALLSIAYIAETDTLIVAAKELIREVRQ